MAGPRATPLRITWLYISPDKGAQKVDRVQIGREMVMAEKSGPWMRVYANTDIVEARGKDAPEFGSDDTPPPISGWMEAKGVVVETTPNGDQILMGAAANQEALASDPRGPANAAESARLLYRRLAEMFPNSPWFQKRRGGRRIFSGNWRRRIPLRGPRPRKKKRICASRWTKTS